MTKFYIECEPLAILSLWKKNARSLIIHKIKAHTKLFYILTSPILISYLFFNPDHIWICLFLVLFWWIGIGFNVTLKYSTYIPNEKLKANTIIMCISTCCILIPFLLPLPLIMMFRNYNLSVKKITTYLND